jgi:very-short-patch-repair endonuclease
MAESSAPNSDFRGLVLGTIEKLRAKLLDLTMANRLLNFKPSDKSKSHVRIVEEVPEALFEKLEGGKELEFVWIEDPELEPADERTREFSDAVKAGKTSDTGYLEQLEKLGKRPSRRQLAGLERGLRDRVRLSLGLPPRLKPSVADRARELGFDPNYDLPRDSGHRSRPHGDSRIQTLLYREVMEAKLSAIRETDKTLLDDAGVNALYAAFGAVEWYESADSDAAIFAPVLFVPVEVRRVLDDGVYLYVLVARDDDIEINQAFGQLIKETHSLELPQWNPESTLSEYFREVERVLESQRRWRLRRWVTVGLFTFAKMAMYRDLETKRWSEAGGLESHSILNDLLAGTEVVSDVTLAPDYEIDSPAMAQKNQTLVTDADSSQHSALIDVSEGKSLVIQGPPGTGKSQTITNIIAAAINEGKRVLFVAEKMAALKVVKDRLDSFGLGAFCLEVHSNKTRKTAVLKSLEERLNLSGSSLDGRYLRQTLESLDQARGELVHYANKMKEEVGETGLTVHEILRGNCIRTPLGECLPTGLRKARTVEPTRVSDATRSELKDLANDLQSVAADVNRWGGLMKHPWRGIENDGLDVFQAEELLSELTSWERSLELLQDEIAATNKETGWGVEDTAKSAERFVIDVLAIPEAASTVNDVLVRKGATEQGVVHLRSTLEDQRNLSSIYDHLIQIFKNREGVDSAKVSEVQSATAVGRELHLEAVTVGNVEALSSERTKTADQLQEARSALRLVSEQFGIKKPVVADVGSMIAAIALLSELPQNGLGLRDEALVADGSAKILERGSKQCENVRALKSLVTADFRLISLPTITEIRAAAATLENSAFLARWFGSKYREARRLYDGIAQANGAQRKRQPGQELDRLARFIAQKQELENDAELRHVGGVSFRGLETQWQALLGVARWASKVRRELPAGSTGNDRCREVLLNGERARLQGIMEGSAPPERTGALKRFLGLGASMDQDIDSVCIAAQAAAALTFELNSALKGLSVNSGVTLRDLGPVAAQLESLEACKERLNSPEAQEILKSAQNGKHSGSEVLEGTLRFLEALGKVAVPQLVRAELYRGSARVVLELLTKHANVVTELLNEVANHKRLVKELGRLNERAWAGFDDLDDVVVDTLRKRISHALANPDALQPYLDFLRIETKARASALEPILKHLEGNAFPYGQLGEAYDFIFFRSCAESILSTDPRLKSHSGVTHEQLRKRYQQLDRKVMDLRRLEIARKLMDVPIPQGNNRGRASEITELALIRRQIGLQRRHAALRDLFKRAGRAAQALKPCFMMSPMSVAQFLDPGGLRFDLVVMDEASQIRPEDAMGAIARGRQLVVVGDPKQLPPTSFFEKVDRDDTTDDNSEEADIHDLTSQESVLDLARGPYQPVRQLRWHYRSQHESLIAFSNHEFYDDTLIVFPSPKGEDPDYGVHLVQVDGVYEVGLNRMEAEAVTEAAQKFMKLFPKRSLGIVAMNKPQQELIQKMMDELFATDVEAEGYRVRWEHSLESVFVKNLENVQGDERDVIFISTVYGKDATGNFFQRLGPINGAHGHRRLNVLFTRAKQQVCLFTSMRASDLRVEESSRWGVKALKNYLAYAQSGHLEAVELTGKEPDSEFERWVMGMLEESGYEVVPQLGVAGYFIDLAIRHPDQRGTFILGVECDGAMYHSARSVRDRDRLRQEVLERLKWNIYRIWSTDWFRNPRAEFQKLSAALETLRQSNASRN